MTSLEITAKGNPALLLPILLVATYLKQISHPLQISKTFHEEFATWGQESVVLRLENGNTIVGKAVFQYFAELLVDDAGPQRASSVRLYLLI